MNQKFAMMFVHELFRDQPWADHNFLDVANAFKNLFSFVKIEFRNVPLGSFDFLVAGERNDNVADFSGFLQKSNVAVVNQCGRHVDHDARARGVLHKSLNASKMKNKNLN